MCAYNYLIFGIDWLIVDCWLTLSVQYFGIYYTPTRREGAILQSPFPSVRLSVRPFVRPSVRSHFRNRYLSFYWKKWLHIYFLFTVRLTNERVGVFLARRSVQHLVLYIHSENKFTNSIPSEKVGLVWFYRWMFRSP